MGRACAPNVRPRPSVSCWPDRPSWCATRLSWRWCQVLGLTWTSCRRPCARRPSQLWLGVRLLSVGKRVPQPSRYRSSCRPQCVVVRARDRRLGELRQDRPSARSPHGRRRCERAAQPLHAAHSSGLGRGRRAGLRRRQQQLGLHAASVRPQPQPKLRRRPLPVNGGVPLPGRRRLGVGRPSNVGGGADLCAPTAPFRRVMHYRRFSSSPTGVSRRLELVGSLLANLELADQRFLKV